MLLSQGWGHHISPCCFMDAALCWVVFSGSPPFSTPWQPHEAGAISLHSTNEDPWALQRSLDQLG